MIEILILLLLLAVSFYLLKSLYAWAHVMLDYVMAYLGVASPKMFWLPVLAVVGFIVAFCLIF